MKRELKRFIELGSKTSSACICASCGKQLTVDSYTTEHMIPKLAGGSSAKYNLCILCSDCNKEKDSILPLNADIAYPYLNSMYKESYNIMLIAFKDIERERMNSNYEKLQYIRSTKHNK